MKLDASALRYLGKEDFRVLSALEIGSKNHQVVPLSMIASLCRMRPGGVNSRLAELAKHRLVSKEHHTSYEGFRLTYGGYDYLALYAMSQRGTVLGVGRQIGVGKESDVYLVEGRYPCETECEEELPTESFVLKIERLGRTSFRTVKTNRDYVGRRTHVSWMYMSRLAAEKEWLFMKALHQHGFPTPKPVDWNRHCIVMEWIEGRTLEQLHPEDWPEGTDMLQTAQYLYDHLMKLIIRLAEHGLVHGDFNEFNLMIKDNFIDEPILDDENHPIVMIDFPQMVSTSHINAKELFERDVNCLRTFFTRRYGFEPTEWPCFDRDVATTIQLDSEVRASGFRGNRGISGIEDIEDGGEGGEGGESGEGDSASLTDSTGDSSNDSCGDETDSSSGSYNDKTDKDSDNSEDDSANNTRITDRTDR